MNFPYISVAGKILHPCQVLFFYEIPILYVCKDIDNELFITYCDDIYELKYCIVRTSKDLLIKMLENQISMDSLFIQAETKWVANVELFEKTCSAQIVDHFEERALPKKGAKYGKLDEDVQKFLKELKDDLFNESFIKKGVIEVDFRTSPYVKNLTKLINIKKNDDSTWFYLTSNSRNHLSEKKSLWTFDKSYKKEDLLCPV